MGGGVVDGRDGGFEDPRGGTPKAVPADLGEALRLAPPHGPHAGLQSCGGVALRARAGAARTAVSAHPPQSAPRSARTCHRARPPARPRPSRPPRPAIAEVAAGAAEPGSTEPNRTEPNRASERAWPGAGAAASGLRLDELCKAAAARRAAGDARLGQLGPAPGLSASPASRLLFVRPRRRLAAFLGHPVLDPWRPPSPCLPGWPGPGAADRGCRGPGAPHAPSPAAPAGDPG
ncbi:basic proline-rich protein-like [Suncus etruscus]|uniref:basic proline-rich protein-like n=1 Tax=Suncus etruscus TaxID=109475 RepID=UPI0021107B58|nr:basic proline-rich protein-like [Suncus etruscus]